MDDSTVHVQENLARSNNSSDSSFSSSESTSLYETDYRRKNPASKRKISHQIRRRVRNRRSLTAMLFCASSSTSDDSDHTFHLETTSDSEDEYDDTSREHTSEEILSDYSSGSFSTSSGNQATFSSIGQSTETANEEASPSSANIDSDSFIAAEPDCSSIFDSISSDDEE